MPFLRKNHFICCTLLHFVTAVELALSNPVCPFESREPEKWPRLSSSLVHSLTQDSMIRLFAVRVKLQLSVDAIGLFPPTLPPSVCFYSFVRVYLTPQSLIEFFLLLAHQSGSVIIFRVFLLTADRLLCVIALGSSSVPEYSCFRPCLNRTDRAKTSLALTMSPSAHTSTYAFALHVIWRRSGCLPGTLLFLLLFTPLESNWARRSRPLRIQRYDRNKIVFGATELSL